jgi:hypothetical protein
MEDTVFRDWGDFYLVTGAAAGALIGLMFVVVTLLAGREATRVERGTRAYITPIVFHYSVVLAVSALGVTPRLPRGALAAMLACGAALGIAYTTVTTLRILRMPGNPPHWTDKHYYGILPSLIYMGYGVGAACLPIAPEAVGPVVGAATVALLLVAIRNSWDLATAITQESAQGKQH